MAVLTDIRKPLWIGSLPASEDAPPAQQEAQDAQTPSLKPGTRVLVLDDEEYIRMVAARWLKKVCYVTKTAEDGQQAIDMYQQALKAGEPFDVIILDLTIPGGMGGQEVLREILALDPDVKAIASSGDVQGAVMSKYAFYGFKDAIAKPYTENELREVLCRVLNALNPAT